MLLQELKRVNQLDAEISNMHQRLTKLYQQRHKLLKVEPYSDWSYESLKKLWASYDVTFPTGQNLRLQYQKAARLVAKLERQNPDLNNSLSIVIVPPSQQLEKVIANLPDPDKKHLSFMQYEKYNQTRKAAKWSVLVVFDAKYSLPVYGLQDFLDRGDYNYDGHDCRGLGVPQMIAAQLQGVKIVQQEHWSILLKDSLSGGPVFCATVDNQQIILDIEDGDCTLGDNVMPLAITIK